MSRDSELDRLGAAQQAAFRRKQDAFAAMDRLGKRSRSICDSADQAYREKQQAWEAQNAVWQDLQRVRNQNGPRIDWLNGQQETAYRNM
jgi:hypothetical protein